MIFFVGRFVFLIISIYLKTCITLIYSIKYKYISLLLTILRLIRCTFDLNLKFFLLPFAVVFKSLQPFLINRLNMDLTLAMGSPQQNMHEMASLPTKTPVSVLQEVLSRRGITPKYELVQIEGAIHEPIFRYRVFLSNDYIANGTGRSKKEAKHAAAKNLLDLIVGDATPEQANPTTNSSGNDITNQVVSPFDDKIMGNPIGWLQEMCMSRRWPPPSYEMEHEEGLPHERQFTIACKVLKFREVGTGKSKKLAKRMAAHKMWQALQDMSVENTNVNQMLDEDEELGGRVSNLQSRYACLKDSKLSTRANNSTHSMKVTHFHKYLKNANGPKITELQTTSLTAKDFNCVQFLQELATELQFETTYVDIEEKSITGKHQCLLQISTAPLAVCFGTGSTPLDAQMSAAFNALEYLKIMTRK